VTAGNDLRSLSASVPSGLKRKLRQTSDVSYGEREEG
jgi:hypothetical protein